MSVIKVVSSGVGAVLALTLAGCGGDSAPIGADEAPAEPTTAAPVVLQEAWTAKGLKPIGQAEVIGETPLVYESRRGRLWLVAIDPADGSELWRKEATPSVSVPGVSLSPEEVGTEDEPLVVMLGRNKTAPLVADLLVLEPTTGKVVHRVKGKYFFSHPDSCVEDTAVCVRARDVDAEQVSSMRLQLADGAFGPVPDEADIGRPVGPDGLVESGDRGPGKEHLIRIVDDQQLWRVPLRKAFGPRATTDFGWTFDHVEDAGVYVGSVGIIREGNNADSRTDLSLHRTVGIDAESGEVVWSAKGTSRFCAKVDADDVHVRCEQSGIRRTDIDNPDAGSTFTDLRSTLQGFDPETGETTWSIDMGDSEALHGRVDLVHASETEIVLTTANGREIVDFADGSTRELADGEVFVCATVESYRYADPVVIGEDRREVHDRVGGSLVRTCGANGKASQGAYTDRLADVYGARVGDLRILATGDGLIGLLP